MHFYNRMWQFAKIAYDRPIGEENLFSGHLSYTTLPRDKDFAFVVEFEEGIIISFRGTGSLKVDGVKCIKEWLSDLNLYPLRSEVRLRRHGRDKHEILVRSEILSDGVWGKGTIHNGFYTTWMKFKDEMTTLVNKLIEKGKPIYCTGHSRGGALAELCARHIAKNMKKSCSCVEYGTPYVGTEEYADQFKALPIEATAVVDGWDIVIDLPPDELGFERGPANEVWLRQPWWHRIFQRFHDHYQEYYTAALEKYYP